VKVPILPKPPPCRLLRGCEWVNEYELVDWYTAMGRKYREVHTEFGIIDKIFISEHKRKLKEALERNDNL